MSNRQPKQEGFELNYEVWEDSDTINPIFLGDFDRNPEFRPHVGDLITLGFDIKVYKINRAEPTDNPADQKVKYFVREFIENQFSQAKIITQTLPNFH